MIIGIDPGKTGAIVALTEAGDVLKHITPTIGTVVDLVALIQILRDLNYKGRDCADPPYAFIEDVHAIYGSSSGATFDFGFTCGAIQAAVASLCIPYTTVQPKVWQKEVYQGIPEVRKTPVVIKKGNRKGQKKKGARDTKKMSLIAAKRLFPTVDFRKNEQCRKPHDGIVDAILIAEYGRRTREGK